MSLKSCNIHNKGQVCLPHAKIEKGKHMQKLKKEDNATYDAWLLSYQDIRVGLLFGIEVKCGMLLNILCESFNNAIIRAKDKPILDELRCWADIYVRSTKG